MNVKFNFLPAFAQYILDQKLEVYAINSLKVSREMDIPVLKFFSNIPDDQIIAISMGRNRQMFQALIKNDAFQYLEESTKIWVTNQLPNIQKDEISADDIVLVSAMRRKVLRNILTSYTNDITLFSNVMEEIDRFTVASDSRLFSTFFQLQSERISIINEKLQKREDELLEAQEIAQIGSFEWDISGKDSKFTPEVFRIFELEKTSGLESFLDDVHPDDREKLSTAIKQGWSNGHFDCEYRYLKNNKTKVIWSRGKIINSHDKPPKMMGTIMDITERSKIINQLQHSEELHKQAQSLTHIGNWSWHIDQEKVNWSDEMYRIYGLAPQSQEISVERFTSFIHPEDKETRVAEIQQAIQNLEVKEYHFRIITDDGETKVLRGRGEIIIDKNNKPVTLTGTYQDITKEFLLNKAVEEREKYLNQLIKNAPDGIIVINGQNDIILWNPKSEDIFGWKSEEVIGKSLSGVIVPPLYREDHLRGMERLLRTGESRILNKTIEIQALNKAGKEFFISLTVSQSTQSEQPIFIAFIRDITQEKKTKTELTLKTFELATLNQSLGEKNLELIRINRELESFNFIASHDLQEPLRKIRIYSNRMLESAELISTPIRDYANKLNQAAERMQQLIEDFLSFSKAVAETQIFEPTNLSAILAESKHELAGILEEKNAIIEADELPVIEAMPFQMKQLLVNLIGNAVKYGRENVVPHVKITSSIIAGNEITNIAALPTASYLKISIADNGIGFDQKYAQKIFELFQRLHNREKYTGTGIGLAICKKIVENHKGFISAQGELDKGAVFNVYLPIKE